MTLFPYLSYSEGLQGLGLQDTLQDQAQFSRQPRTQTSQYQKGYMSFPIPQARADLTQQFCGQHLLNEGRDLLESS